MKQPELPLALHKRNQTTGLRPSPTFSFHALRKSGQSLLGTSTTLLRPVSSDQAARTAVQREARKCANEYWTELSMEIKHASATGNNRLMYDGIKKALGPRQNKTAPIKTTTGEPITDKLRQMER